MALAGGLCPKCREQLKAGEREISADDLLSTIRDCCSQTPEFITQKLSILESIFRLFLANGNQPLDLEELGKQLNERRGEDAYRTSPEILSRLLSNDRYYAGAIKVTGKLFRTERIGAFNRIHQDEPVLKVTAPRASAAF